MKPCRFVIVNEGKLEHDVLGTKATLDRHAKEMASMNGMHMRLGLESWTALEANERASGA